MFLLRREPLGLDPSPLAIARISFLLKKNHAVVHDHNKIIFYPHVTTHSIFRIKGDGQTITIIDGIKPIRMPASLRFCYRQVADAIRVEESSFEMLLNKFIVIMRIRTIVRALQLR